MLQGRLVQESGSAGMFDPSGVERECVISLICLSNFMNDSPTADGDGWGLLLWGPARDWSSERGGLCLFRILNVTQNLGFGVLE